MLLPLPLLLPQVQRKSCAAIFSPMYCLLHALVCRQPYRLVYRHTYRLAFRLVYCWVYCLLLLLPRC
jgi:hypothetical protein